MSLLAWLQLMFYLHHYFSLLSCILSLCTPRSIFQNWNWVLLILRDAHQIGIFELHAWEDWKIDLKIHLLENAPVLKEQNLVNKLWGNFLLQSLYIRVLITFLLRYSTKAAPQWRSWLYLSHNFRWKVHWKLFDACFVCTNNDLRKKLSNKISWA